MGKRTGDQEGVGLVISHPPSKKCQISGTPAVLDFGCFHKLSRCKHPVVGEGSILDWSQPGRSSFWWVDCNMQFAT